MDVRKSVQPHPTLPVLFWSFAKIGAFTIGGGYAMVPLIRAELVQRQAWLPDEEFAEILGLSQAAPGAIAINTAVFAGYRLRGLAGALVGCLGVVLPSFVIILAIATMFGRLSRLSLVERMFRGMRPAIVGLILAAVIAMSRSILRTWRQWAVAGALFILIVLADPHPILVLAAAGSIGCFLPGLVAPATRQKLREGEGGAVLVGALLGLTLAFFTIGALTFGGGYAMIPLIQRIIIAQHGWLNTTQFLDIVAIAEMTPGPIAVNSATFVGYRVAGLAGAVAATLGVVLPSLVIIIILASLFYRFRNLPIVFRTAAGLRMAVISLIAGAVITVGRSSILGWRDAAVAGAVVALLRATRIHPILVILGAAVVGVFLY